MATQAHCAYAFECLAASFDRRQPLSLAQVEELWEQHHATALQPSDDTVDGAEDVDAAEDAIGDDAEMTDVDAEEEATIARPAAISRLLNKGSASSTSATSSSSSLPLSARSAASSTSQSASGSGADTPATSRSSLLSSGKKSREQREEHPLFVTWNTVSGRGHKSLRGCIGTFEPQELEYGLRSYALTSAFEDTRFSPIPATLLPNLSTHVTLLTNFSSPTKDPLDWTLGTHGLRISFSQHGRRYGATYLPDVAKEQGWTKEETLISLMRKAGWNGSSSSWQKTWRDGRGELVRYEGKPAGLHYDEWKEWRDWTEKSMGVTSKALN